MKKKIKNPTPDEATWYDHQQLLFWLRACLRNADVYLTSSRSVKETFEKMFSGGLETMIRYKGEHQECSDKTALDAYHFVVVTGNLLRLLKRAQYLFPAIQPPYSRARHLLSEGKDLRDMIEHAHGNDGYLVGGGRHSDKFVRSDSPKQGISADAISTVIDERGHWLGGRLCVELVVDEVLEIYYAAQKIPAPEAE
ncbi:hypothetical protein [Aeromonas sp. QDB54]|uniref:hypothetical protein n=1 Tax=Aeromonas sp. QDB54 TaxID=2989826 RepID=UPI0022E69BF4|nr:hypothetical protein [Aeromonas sp. QDB54]